MFGRGDGCSAEAAATRLQADSAMTAPKSASSCKLDGNRLFLIQAVVLWAVLVVPTVGVAAALYLAQIANHQEEGQLGRLFNATGEDLANSITIFNTSEPTTSDISANETPQNVSGDPSWCFELRGDYERAIEAIFFWVKGVALTVIGAFGLVGNIITIIVLSGIKGNQNFNCLLMTLASTDMLLIVFFIMEKSVVETFLASEPTWYRWSYPYVLHPARGVIESMSIFMVVAITVERFRAVCFPLSRRHSPTKFVAYVLFLSVTLELPRWFEFQPGGDGAGEVQYWTTELMEDPHYIRFSSYWSELVTTGFVPLLALIYFNTKIYLKIRASADLEHRYVGGRSRLRMTSMKTGGGGTILISTPVTSQRTDQSEATAARLPEDVQSSLDGVASSPELEAKAPSRPLLRPTSAKYRIGTNLKREVVVDADDDDGRCFKKKREKSTIILVSIVLTFIACHVYRLALKVYEFAHPSNHTHEHFYYCKSIGRYSVPAVFFILLSTNDIFLVFNASINFVIYCCVGKEFKRRLWQIVTNLFKK